jgi:hypothetical protein
LSHRDVAGAIIRHLMTAHKAISGSVQVMVAARQLYTMAYRDLERRLANLNPKEREHIFAAIRKDEVFKDQEIPADLTPEETWEIVEGSLVDAAAHAGSQEFDERILKLALGGVEAWYEEVLPDHVRWTAEDRRAAIEAWDKARRERAIPLGVDFDPHAAQLLGRSRSLVFYGWRPAVLWLLDRIANHVISLREDQLFCVLRLMRYAPHVVPSRMLIRVPSNLWEDCCRNSTAWERLYKGRIDRWLSEPVDLLVVDDLAWAGKSTSLIGGQAARKAGNAHKQFRKWANEVGCAIIGGVLTEEQVPPAPTGTEWEQLRLFTTLRPVWVQENEENKDQYLLHVGRDLATFTVDKATMESYGSTRSTIWSPSDDPPSKKEKA